MRACITKVVELVALRRVAPRSSGATNTPRLGTLKIVSAISCLLMLQRSAFACATCYGASDSPLAQGMNWGIITLLGVVGSVMFGITAFFVYIGIKSARLGAVAVVPTPNSTDSIS